MESGERKLVEEWDERGISMECEPLVNPGSLNQVLGKEVLVERAIAFNARELEGV